MKHNTLRCFGHLKLFEQVYRSEIEGFGVRETERGGSFETKPETLAG